MAVSTFFQDEIDQVDNTQTLVYVIDGTYTEFEWSYNGLEVRGGTELACEYGASALLEAMGFRFYSPNEAWGYVRPPSIPTGLSASKQTYWLPNCREFLTYGHSWHGTNVASRNLLNDRQAKFATLHGMQTEVWPAGHRWNNVITNNQAYFDSNPQLLLESDKFDLSVTGSDYDNLTEICAAHLLNEGLNDWNRTNFDPTDGDLQDSDSVYQFTKDVVDKVRAGTSAIGTIAAQTGVPGAQIGIYAYGGHRLPPTTGDYSGVYTQVALGFNDTELTYLELVEQHGTESDAILLREYWDTHTWSNGQPIVNSRTDSLYFGDDYTGAGYEGNFSPYVDYRTGGAIGLTAEYSANWLVNLVQHRWITRKLKTGLTTYADALDDVMSDLFNDDQAVRDLYEYWSDPDPNFTYDKTSLLQSFDYVDAMATGWYKTYFQYLCVLLYEQLYMPPQLAPTHPDWNTVNDPFPDAFSKHKAHITAVRDLDIAHCYAWLRREANGVVSGTYPDLWMYKTSPEADWFENPYLPTESDFTTYHAAIASDVAATVPSAMNTRRVWRGPVQPASESPSGNEVKLWRGPVQPSSAGSGPGAGSGGAGVRGSRVLMALNMLLPRSR